MVKIDDSGMVWIIPGTRRSKKPEPAVALADSGQPKRERVIMRSANPCDWSVEERLQFLNDTLPVIAGT